MKEISQGKRSREFRPRLVEKVVDRNAAGYDPDGSYDVDSVWCPLLQLLSSLVSHGKVIEKTLVSG